MGDAYDSSIDHLASLGTELVRPAVDGGAFFCGVSEEQFAINGVTYQWPKGSDLTWSIDFSSLGSLSDRDVKDAIHSALKEIAECCDVTHRYIANAAAANIRITRQRLDGKSGVLADCQIPVGNVAVDRTSLLMRIDDSESWVLSETPGQSIDFYRVVLHELLHGHGLGHKPASIREPALIAPMYSPVLRNLQPADKAELVRRYGSRQVAPPPPSPVPGGTPVIVTIEQGGKKWQGPIPKVA